MTEFIHPVTAIYQACDPTESLDSNDDRYVSLAAARGEDFAEKGGWRRQISKTIYQSKSPACCLLSGFLGDGKSTELKKLINELKAGKVGGPKLAAIYVDCEQYINPEAYSFVDVLIAIIGETGKQLLEYGVDFQRSYLSNIFTDIITFVTSDLALESVDAKTKTAPFEAALKLSLKTKAEATIRKKMWTALEGKNSDLAEEFGNFLLKQARPVLKEKGYDDIVIVVDWLEKLICFKADEKGSPNSHVDLFIHHAPHFMKFKTHLVLTVPIDLVYSAEQERLTSAYGREPDVISAVRVVDHFPEDERRVALNAMLELLRKRFEYVEGPSIAFTKVFPDQKLAEELIEFSGGHPRQLLILIRQCLQFIDELPISREAFEAAKKKEVQAASRKVPEKWFNKLAAVHFTHRIDNDSEHLEMLRTLCVFAYANSEPVYSVDPAILQLKRMKEVISSHGKSL